MKGSISDLAVAGGNPVFANPRHVGQCNLPDWNDFRSAFEDIFERGYFTNHGPMVQDFDQQIAEYLGVKHAVNVTNGTVALLVACRALNLKGNVVVPAFTFPATVQALTWAGLTPIFADVDKDTHNLTAETVEDVITETTSAVLGVHLWGRGCDPENLEKLCRSRNIALIFDSAHGFGASHNGKMLGNFGDIEIFSFHFTKVMNAGEGGAVVTNNKDLAQKVRTVRNFHDSETFAESSIRINGKMTEAQASLGLLSLKQLPTIISRNKSLYQSYRRLSGNIAGWRFIDHAAGQDSNYQYCVCQIDERVAGLTRNELISILRDENILARSYFAPGMHKLRPYIDWPCGQDAVLPNTDELAENLLQLPLGSGVDEDDIEKIMSVVRLALNDGRTLKAQYLPDKQS